MSKQRRASTKSGRVSKKELSRLQNSLTATATQGDDTATKITCYNSKCPDYRRERNAHEPCACKRTRVKGAGI